MSIVTGVMLIVSLLDADDDDPISEVKAWLREREYAPGAWALKEVSDQAGGWKHPQFAAFTGGFNMFDEDDFASFVMSRPWNDPEALVLILQPEDGATRVFRPKGYGVEPVAEQPPEPQLERVGPPDFTRWTR